MKKILLIRILQYKFSKMTKFFSFKIIEVYLDEDKLLNNKKIIGRINRWCERLEWWPRNNKYNWIKNQIEDGEIKKWSLLLRYGSG